jgi:hypothetical protein
MGATEGSPKGKGEKAMHYSKERIFEMAQEGKKLGDKDQMHLKQCDRCGELFRMFVLQRLYRQEAQVPLAEYLRR